LADRLASELHVGSYDVRGAARRGAARRHRTLRAADLRLLLGQALHSWYIAYFRLPVLPEVMARSNRAARLWTSALHRMEHAPTDEDWPASTFGADFSHGVQLYRANVFSRMRRPRAGSTSVPVQLIVPTHDRYVTPPLLQGLENWTSLLWRRPVDAGHWVIRTHPDEVATWVREVVAYVEEGTESGELRRCRVEVTRPAT
jgi:pimeloyl-ACP methyl ester carboxylesterase